MPTDFRNKIKYNQFLDDLKLLHMRFPVAQLSRELTEGKGNVSAYLRGKIEPSDNFYEKFYEKYGEEINKKKSSIPPKGIDVDDKRLTEKIIYELTLTNKMLTQNNQTLADSGKTIADNTTMLMRATTGYADLRNRSIDEATFRRALESVLDLIVEGVKFESKELALAELYKNVFYSQMTASEVGKSLRNNQDKDQK